METFENVTNPGTCGRIVTARIWKRRKSAVWCLTHLRLTPNCNIQSIKTGAISCIITFIQSNIAILNYYTDYDSKCAALAATCNARGRECSMKTPGHKAATLRPTLLLFTNFSTRFDIWTCRNSNHAIFQRCVPQQQQLHREPIICDSAFSETVPAYSYHFRILVVAKRNESRYVSTRELLNPQQNVCWYKRTRTRVDRVLVYWSQAGIKSCETFWLLL